jgi:ankyrin repeat protein
MKGLLHIFLILAFFVHTGDFLAGDPVLEWIENGETARIEKYLEEHDINAVIGSPGTTMLVYSILHAGNEMTEWLIARGADIDLPVEGMSPLMVASGLDNVKKVSALLGAGADLEAFDCQGNTALFYAAGNGNLKIVKLLLRRGANLSHKNTTWQTAYDMALINSRTETAKYLRDQHEKSLPDLLDGP